MATFTPRLTSAGMLNNPYWYANNPFYQSGYGLPNCTCYAWGRWYEITGSAPTLSLGNGEDWYNYNDGHARGQTPRLGAIICFQNGPYSGLGHVAVVEEINGDEITFSNSAYNGQYFYLVKGTAANNYGYASGYDYQGFIYLDDQPTPPGPGPSRTSKMPIWMYLRKF